MALPGVPYDGRHSKWDRPRAGIVRIGAAGLPASIPFFPRGVARRSLGEIWPCC